MHSPTTFPSSGGVRQHLFERNTFLDCRSPWALEPIKTLQKSASAPGPLTKLGVLKRCEDAFGCSSEDSTGASTSISCVASSCESTVHTSELSESLDGLDSVVDASPAVKHDILSLATDAGRPILRETLVFAGEAHLNGTCQPCRYVARRNGCHLGDGCPYCHESHMPGYPGTKWRPSKKRRELLKVATSEITIVLPAMDGGDVPKYEFGEMPPWISANPYILQKIKNKAAEQVSDPQFGVTYRL